MENFEEKLKRLEQLSQVIKQSDVSLEDALKAFEEGIKLSKGMEKDLDQMEGKIQILMNTPAVQEEKSEEPKKTESAAKAKGVQNGPVLDFFNDVSQVNGTRS